MNHVTSHILDQLPGAKKLANWLQQVIVLLGEGVGGVALHIKDVGEHARREKVRDYAVDASRDADRLALEVMHDAQEQADGTGSGGHRFVCYAIRGHELTPFQSYGFRLVSQVNDEDEPDGANEKALLADGRRHLEATQKILAQSFGQQQACNMQIIELLLGQLSEYRGRELESLKVAHQVTIERAQLQYDQKTQEFFHDAARGIGKLAGPIVVPALLDRLLGTGAVESQRDDAGAAPQIPETVSPAVDPIVVVTVSRRAKPKRTRPRR